MTYWKTIKKLVKEKSLQYTVTDIAPLKEKQIQEM